MSFEFSVCTHLTLFFFFFLFNSWVFHNRLNWLIISLIAHVAIAHLWAGPEEHIRCVLIWFHVSLFKCDLDQMWTLNQAATANNEKQEMRLLHFLKFLFHSCLH